MHRVPLVRCTIKCRWAPNRRTRRRNGPPLPSLFSWDVRVSFDGPIYAEVVRAYRSRLIVRCEGDLVREHGEYTLRNARYFRVLETADTD